MKSPLAKLLEIAPNILNKQNTQAFIQQAPQNNYGNFAQDMAALQEEANTQALANKMNELQQPAVQNNSDGIKNKLLSGFADFQRGYNENFNNGFNPNNFGNNQFTNVIPANTEKLTNYQQELFNSGMSGTDKIANWDKLAPEAKQNIVSAVAEGKNSGYVPIDNWIKANQDAFNPTTETFQKTGLGKLGEAAGTAMRFANSPAGQALIQGALVGLANQDWGKGVAAGLQAAQDRAASNMYSKALQQEGIDLGTPSLLGNISQKDYASIMNQKDKQWDRDYKVKKFEADENYRTKDLARREEDSKSNREYREKMLGLKGQELNLKRIKTSNKGSGQTAAERREALKEKKEREKEAREQAMWDAAEQYKNRIEEPIGKDIFGRPKYMSDEDVAKMKWQFKKQFHKDPDELIL